jgi:CDP-diglyceride synthetase
MNQELKKPSGNRYQARSRWIIGSVVALLLIAMTWLALIGGPGLNRTAALILAGGMGSAAFVEARRILQKGLRYQDDPVLDRLTLGIAWVVWLLAAMQSHLLIAGLYGALLALSVLALWRGRGAPAQTLGAEMTLMAWLIFPIGAGISIWTGRPLGPLWIVWLALVVKGADTAAYIIGPRFGRRPFFASISPKKTVEGFLAALVFGGVAGSAGLYALQLGSLLQGATLGVLFSCLGAFGDLGESALKRQAGVKDSGSLPGIGGALDICDALLVGLPLLWLLT